MVLVIDATGVTISRVGAENYVFKCPPDRLNHPPVPARIFVAQYNAALTKTAMIQDAIPLALTGENISLFFRLKIPMNQAISGSDQLGSFFAQ
jgi:hypothetical protein